MTAFALLFTLAAIGISETVYLIRERKLEEKPVCPIGGGCVVVLTSKYNRTFGIHNDLLGLLFYAWVAFLTALIVIGNPYAEYWMLIVMASVAGAGMMSLYFVFLQWRVIKAWCFWCLMSAATIGLMAIILLSEQLHLLQAI